MVFALFVVFAMLISMSSIAYFYHEPFAFHMNLEMGTQEANELFTTLLTLGISIYVVLFFFLGLMVLKYIKQNKRTQEEI